MEILNNIWTVLTTPSQFNTELILLPFTVIENFIIITLVFTILNISTTDKRKTIFIIMLSSFITIISGFLIPSPFNIFINYIPCFLLLIFILKITPFKALVSLVCSVAIFSIISILVLNPYITLFNITKEELSNIPIYNIGFLLLNYAVNYILILILKIRNIEINILEDFDKKHKYFIFANFIFGIFTIIVQGFIVFYYIDKLPIIITFLSCISLLAYFVISLYSITRVTKLTLTTRKLESAEEYNKTLHILHDNVRGFKHDFDNIVTTIGGYVRTNDMKGLKKYYIQLEDDCQRVNNLYLLNPEIVNNPRYLQSTY